MVLVLVLHAVLQALLALARLFLRAQMPMKHMHKQVDGFDRRCC
jgi:hypothetical protein